jgi:hypothetical protein
MKRGELVMMTAEHAFRECKSVLAAACCALARLDADRLEEMALSCEALSKDSHSVDSVYEVFALEPERAAHEMAILAGVIEATRVNRNVLQWLCAKRLAGNERSYGLEGHWRLGVRHVND